MRDSPGLQRNVWRRLPHRPARRSQRQPERLFGSVLSALALTGCLSSYDDDWQRASGPAVRPLDQAERLIEGVVEGARHAAEYIASDDLPQACYASAAGGRAWPTSPQAFDAAWRVS